MSVPPEGVTGGAFAIGFSLLHSDWIQIEIEGVPFMSEGGYPVVEVWVPSVEGEHAHTIAALSQIIPKTKLARELLALKPARRLSP